MKVYVLKNKEGKYYDGYDRECFVDRLDKSVIYTEEEYCYMCKNKFNVDVFVECTLCEGDLEKELAVYKRAYYLTCEMIAKGVVDSSLKEDVERCIDDTKCVFLEQARKELGE